MSLKQFHIVFIFASVVICLWFGFWGVQSYMSHDIGAGTLALSIGSIILGIALTVYDVMVYRKFKTMGV